MKLNQFLIQLGVVTLLAAVLVFGLNYHPDMMSAERLSWAAILSFFLLTILVFFLSTYAAKQENKNIFTSVAFLIMMTKMLLCILMVAVYVKTCQPTSNFFLIPFFCIYIIYTTFEVYVMTRLGKDG